MTEDPIVAEVRKVRHEHAEKFNNDIAAICADYRRMEKDSGRQYVSYPPRRIEPPAAGAPPNDIGEAAGRAASVLCSPEQLPEK